MRLDGRGVDQHLDRRPSSLCERMEEVEPDAFRRPADVTIIERLLWTVGGWRIDPAAT